MARRRTMSATSAMWAPAARSRCAVATGKMPEASRTSTFKGTSAKGWCVQRTTDNPETRAQELKPRRK
eukprot:10098112-Alexandrium_andersonii.AAC.1